MVQHCFFFKLLNYEIYRKYKTYMYSLMNTYKTNTRLTTILIKKLPLPQPTHVSLLDRYLLTLLKVATILNFMIIITQIFFMSLTFSLPIQVHSFLFSTLLSLLGSEPV